MRGISSCSRPRTVRACWNVTRHVLRHRKVACDLRNRCRATTSNSLISNHLHSCTPAQARFHSVIGLVINVCSSSLATHAYLVVKAWRQRAVLHKQKCESEIMDITAERSRDRHAGMCKYAIDPSA
eukprot:6179089-Pleurochrysis_carterae.AAC.6